MPEGKLPLFPLDSHRVSVKDFFLVTQESHKQEYCCQSAGGVTFYSHQRGSQIVMSRERLPFIGSSGRKTAKAPHTSPAPQRHHTTRRKLNQQHHTTSSSYPPSILLSNSTMTPWGSLALSESSFTSIPTAPPVRPPLPPPPPPPPPPPQSTPVTPYQEEEDNLSSSFNSEVPSLPLTAPQRTAAAALDKGLRGRKRVLPQRRPLRPARLPPLRPVTNLSFSRSFTFSFFELPLYQTPQCRAERNRNLLQFLRQIEY